MNTQLCEKKIINHKKFMMITKKGFKPQVGLSLIGGIKNNFGLGELSQFGSDSPLSSVGLEISLQCPLMCTKKNYIRQQVAIVYSKNDILNSLEVEINPHYRFLVTPTFELAAGPGFGLNHTSVNGSDEFNHMVSMSNGENLEYQGLDSNSFVFSYGLGASAAVHLGKFFIGLEARYFLTTKGTFDLFTIESNLANLEEENSFISDKLDFNPSTNTFSLSDNLNNFRTVFKIGYKF